MRTCVPDVSPFAHACVINENNSQHFLFACRYDFDMVQTFKPVKTFVPSLEPLILEPTNCANLHFHIPLGSQRFGSVCSSSSPFTTHG